MRAAELFDRQDGLRAEADEVALDLRLDDLLRPLGEPVRVGSAALGLMVQRDLDVTVVCSALDRTTVEGIAQVGARLAVHPRVWQVQFRDDTGAWNIDPAYPDGLYLGVRYRSAAGRDWNLDVWFVDEPERQPDLAHLRTMPARLDPEARAAILRVKQALADRPDDGPRVRSYSVYRAVLEHGVRTPEQFDEWLADGGG